MTYILIYDANLDQASCVAVVLMLAKIVPKLEMYVLLLNISLKFHLYGFYSLYLN